MLLELLFQPHVAHGHAGLSRERFENGRIRRGEVSREFGAALDEPDPLAVHLDRHGQHRLLVGVRRLALIPSGQEQDANPAQTHAVLERGAHARQQGVEVVGAGQRFAETHDELCGVGLRSEHPAVGEPFEPGAYRLEGDGHDQSDGDSPADRQQCSRGGAHGRRDDHVDESDRCPQQSVDDRATDDPVDVQA